MSQGRLKRSRFSRRGYQRPRATTRWCDRRETAVAFPPAQRTHNFRTGGGHALWSSVAAAENPFLLSGKPSPAQTAFELIDTIGDWAKTIAFTTELPLPYPLQARGGSDAPACRLLAWRLRRRV